MSFVSRTAALLAVVLSATLALSACGSGNDNSVTVYSGRSESLVQSLLAQFEEETGIEVLVRYASTSGTVALLLEEGDNSPADIVLLQDAGALGALEKEGMLRSLPSEILDRVEPRFRSRNGSWVGLSGRARTVVYNVEAVDPERDLPNSILDFTDPKWSGRIGWAPVNGSFQAFVTALRVTMGDDAAIAWLEGINANEPTSFPNNTSIVEAVGRGDVEVGFVNHYYMHQFLAERGEGFGARNYYLNGRHWRARQRGRRGHHRDYRRAGLGGAAYRVPPGDGGAALLRRRNARVPAGRRRRVGRRRAVDCGAGPARH